MENPSLSIMLLGETNVGKTALIHRYTNKEFISDFYITVGTDFITKDITIDNEVIKTQIWDTAGQERFMTISRSFYSRSDGILLIYDLTEWTSYKRLNTWITNINACAGISIPKYLVANKTDLVESRQISREEGEIIAKKNGMKYFETSALTGENVDIAFQSIVKEANEVKKGRIMEPSFILRRGNEARKKKKCCS